MCDYIFDFEVLDGSEMWRSFVLKVLMMDNNNKKKIVLINVCVCREYFNIDVFYLCDCVVNMNRIDCL